MLSTNSLAKRIIDKNLLPEGDLQKIIADARASKKSLISCLLADESVNPSPLAQIVSEEFGLPLLDLNSLDLSHAPKDIISDNLIARHSVLPLYQRGKTLFVGMADPTNLQVVDDLKFNTGLKIEIIIIDKHLLDKQIEDQNSDIEDLFDEGDNSLDLLDGELDDAYVSEETSDDDGDPSNDAPVVRFVHKVLLDAIRTGASDIHFEPYEKRYRVRFRTDGILHEIASPPIHLGPRIASRVKIIANIDISEKRMPQDGRIKFKLNKSKAIDFRVNTLPTLWGEKIVLRILDASSAQVGIDALGYEDIQKEMFLHALSEPQGLILVTGPTGSGKTVSLYTGLNILNTPERNISTAEDPVEINLEGVNQVQVNAKINFNFSDALRAFLRQDPDIIMVGEIRDLSTAEIAIKAAQTGHLVLSTLHTNSAADTINRLMNMGVAPFNLATSVSLIIAQRLARRLCKTCAAPVNVPKEALLDIGFQEHELGELNIKEPVGCEICNNGYKGRAGIFEVVSITSELASMIMEGKNSIQLSEQIEKEGFNTLRKSALNKAKEGIISLEEVNRVTAAD